MVMDHGKNSMNTHTQSPGEIYFEEELGMLDWVEPS